MLRKDLLTSAAIGAGLALVSCLILTPHTSTQTVPVHKPEQKAVSEPDKVAVREITPRIASADTPRLQTPVTPAPHEAPAPVSVATRIRRPVNRFKTPELLPVSVPSGENNAPVAAAMPLETTALPPTPVERNIETPALTRAVTAQEARAALGEVGSNPAAEAVWIAAINDPNMPANQRKDLIEDLNEEGFADPKHLTASDLPRIESRLILIEDLAPTAIDQTNADAFQEAYKDLKEMHARLNKP